MNYEMDTMGETEKRTSK